MKRPSPTAIWTIVKDGLATPRPIGRRQVPEIAAARTARADEIRRTLTHATSARIGDLIAQATEHYAEQDRRAERTERRATTLQGAVSVAAAVIAASSGVLLGSNRIDAVAA